MSAPLLSVVVPTKDRAVYAVHCLRTLTRLPDPDLEIVVQDNSATDALGRMVAEQGDGRVRYEHRPERMSVIDNCERGMARATGTYVTLLGDDDGVTGALMDVARWAARQDLDALVPAQIARYTWPDITFKHYGRAFAGMLTVRPYGGAVRHEDVAAGVRRSLREALQDVTETVMLPKLYYGLVHHRAIEALRRRAGTVFPGVSPDMSAAIGLSAFVTRLVSIDYPVFLPGSSARSTAGAHARKEHVGRLADQPHLPAGCEATWPIEVPAVFTVQTVWAQSGLAALRATGRDAEAASLDVGLLHGMIGVLNGGCWGAVMPSYRRLIATTRRPALPAFAELASGVARAWALRFGYLRGRVLRDPWYVGEHRRSGLATIEDAVAALEAWMAAKGVRPRLDAPNAG